MPPNNTSPIHKKRALLLCVLLGLIILGSLLWIVLHSSQVLLHPNNKDAGLTASQALVYADIYQNGELKQSILLSAVTDSYTLTIHGDENNYNELEIRPGSIGMISASCPDKLCVHQGFIHNSLLPITCLPNRLVIQLREEKLTETDTDNEAEITPDIITY